MNIENVKKAIAVMERAKARGSVFMSDWQSSPGGGYLSFSQSKLTEDEFHSCGNKACFAGHIAISPEFKNDGGYAGDWGVPYINKRTGENAIANWLGISNETACNLVYEDDGSFYAKEWELVTADDVLEKLHMILRGELQ